MSLPSAQFHFLEILREELAAREASMLAELSTGQADINRYHRICGHIEALRELARFAADEHERLMKS